MQKTLIYFLRGIGALLIFIGLVGAYYGPLEIHVFSFFSEGGQFHYPGFGFGSLWFAYLVVQNTGYYIVAALCLPLGFGHLKRRRWVPPLARLYAWFWLGAGILIIANLMALIPALSGLDLSHDILIERSILIGLVALGTLIAAPILVHWFYGQDSVRQAFVQPASAPSWIEEYPAPLLGLLLLLLIAIFVLHIAIFIQAIFPFFGTFLKGRPAVYVISGCVLILGILMYGIIRLENWAWWGALGALSSLTISSFLSFSRHSFYDMIEMLKLPAFEMDFIDKLALIHDFHLVGWVVPPLVVALGLLIYSKRYFASPK